MLQFIVLGLIPGTRIQITFGWIVLAILLCASLTMLSMLLARLINSQMVHLKAFIVLQTTLHS